MAQADGFAAPAPASEGNTGGVLPWRLALIGFLLVVASAWAGIVPFVGPLFGYSADGTSSWDWTLSHGLLHVLPGAIGVLCGLIIFATAGGGRAAAALSSMCGLVTAAAGAWLVLGPWAWPIFENTAVFSSSGSAVDQFQRVVGYNLGIGGIILLLSGMVLQAATGGRRPTRAPT